MFRSYQTILRELLCLVFKLLEAAYICAPLVMQQHAFRSGYVPLSLLMCLLRELVCTLAVPVLATDTSTTKGTHNLI